MLGLLFGMCKSQHAADVKAQHERRSQKKDTKSVKEIHTHLNLQPHRSPIASEGEESLEIESFEERWLVLTRRTRCSSGTRIWAFVASPMALTLVPILLTLNLFCLPLQIAMMKKMKKVAKRVKTLSKAHWRPSQLFLMLNDKGGEKRLKLQGASSVVPSVLFYLKIPEHPVCQNRMVQFWQTELIFVFSFLVSVDLRT
jgi:hypothetical protein